MTTTPTFRKDRSTVTTAPAAPRTLYGPTGQAPTEAPHVVTDEEVAKARKAVAELEQHERLVTTILLVLGIGGLIFTAVNVTLFAVGHDVSSYIAWMLDPLVSISLLTALFIDGKLAAHGYKPGGWPFLLRWFAGVATWLMNCWGAFYPDGKFTGWPNHPDPAALLLHSVVPFLVIFLAEAGAGWRRFCTRKKTEHQKVVTLSRDQAEATRRAKAEEQRRREEADRASKEAERQREEEARRQKDREDAEARRLTEETNAKARLAQEDRLTQEARLRGEAEAREQQARIDRENAAQRAEFDRQRILAEAQAQATTQQAAAHAEAETLRAEAEVKAAEDAREERRRAAEARRVRTALPPAEATALPETRTALPAPGGTAETRKPTALPPAETDDVRGAEAKRKQIEEATFEAAVLMRMDLAPTRKDFAAQYGRGETWGRERYADAEQQLADDAGFANRVAAEVASRNRVLMDAS